MKLKHININNIDIPYILQDNGFEDTIVYVHGLNSSTDSLSKVLKMKLNFNIIAINYPGNKYLPNFTANFEEYVEITKKLLAKINSKRIHLLGHSLGGAIIANVARFPMVDLQFYVSALVPYDYDTHYVKFMRRILQKQSMFKTFVDIANRTIELDHFLNDGLVEMFSKVAEYTETSRQLMIDFVFNGTEIEKLRVAYSLTNPDKTHFIIGDRDKVVKADKFKSFVESELNRKSIVLEKCDHNPFTNNTEKVIDYINSVIKPIKRKDSNPILIAI